MAKLKPIDFSFKSKTGEELTFRADVSVSDTTGAFSLTIPDSLEQTARRVAASHPFPVALDRPRQNLRVTGPTLDGCKQFIAHCATDFLACEVTEELVIVYDTNFKVAYVKDDEGNFFENGYACKEKYDTQAAVWHGALHATNQATHFQVGLVAKVMKKTTYTRPSGVAHRYERSDAPKDSWMARLNGFSGLYLKFDSKEELPGYKQIPYTEDAAKFFYFSMLSMCQLADRINQCFGDEASLKLAIEKNAGLLTSN